MAEGEEQRARRRRILRLAIPVMGGMVSQTVLNLVDTAMVGRLGTTPLAATGLASYVNVVSIALLMGVAAGVQAKASQAIGAGHPEKAALPLNAGLVLTTLLGLPTALVMITLAPHILALLSGDTEVVAIGTPYLQVRQLGVVAVGINFVFRGFWNAIERPHLYLRTLLLVHATNIFLNWVLIFGNLGAPALGATGAGCASAAAVIVGSISHLSLAARYARGAGFLRARPTRPLIRDLIELALPAGAQQLLFFLGMMLFFSIVGRVSPTALAAGTVLMNLSLAWILPGNAFGLAAASFAGQAFGARDPDDADRWVRQVARLAAMIVGSLAVPAVFFPEPILAVFLAEPEALALARRPLQITAATITLEAVGIVMLNAHLGVGAMRRVFSISTLSLWAFCIPTAIVVGPVFGAPFLVVWSVWVTYRLLMALAMVWSWTRRDWANAVRRSSD